MQHFWALARDRVYDQAISVNSWAIRLPSQGQPMAPGCASATSELCETSRSLERVARAGADDGSAEIEDVRLQVKPLRPPWQSFINRLRQESRTRTSCSLDSAITLTPRRSGPRSSGGRPRRLVAGGSWAAWNDDRLLHHAAQLVGDRGESPSLRDDISRAKVQNCDGQLRSSSACRATGGLSTQASAPSRV
jgi:hypothetical protein